MNTKENETTDEESAPAPETGIEAVSIPGPKRLNYYDGQLLLSEGLREEQMYFLHKLRQQNRAHFSTGVIKGLTLTCSQHLVTVSPGFAMDGVGQLVELAAPCSFELPGKDGTWEIIIELVEEKCNSSWWSDEFAPQGEQQFSSIQETVKIRAREVSNDEAHVSSDTSVCLGRITVNEGSFKVE